MIKLVQPSIGSLERTAVSEVLRSLHLDRGDVTKSLEEKLKQEFGAKHAIVTCNGTAALYAALIASGVSSGDEVITTPFSFMATANAILLANAVPVFVDIDPETFLLDPNKVESAITRKTRAILPVDLYGHPADYDQLRKIAKRNHLSIISDSCQAVGATYRGKSINAYTTATVYSFYNSKILSSGEGGAILTNDSKIAEQVNLLTSHGQKRGKKYQFISPGWNFRPTDIQSALISAQLSRLQTIVKNRQTNALAFSKMLMYIDGIITPVVRDTVKHSYSRFTLKVTSRYQLSRKELQTKLKDSGIESEVAYPKPLFRYPHLKQFAPNNTWIVDRCAKEVLSIPIHQNLSADDIKLIASVIEQGAKK